MTSPAFGGEFWWRYTEDVARDGVAIPTRPGRPRASDWRSRAVLKGTGCWPLRSLDRYMEQTTPLSPYAPEAEGHHLPPDLCRAALRPRAPPGPEWSLLTEAEQPRHTPITMSLLEHPHLSLPPSDGAARARHGAPTPLPAKTSPDGRADAPTRPGPPRARRSDAAPDVGWHVTTSDATGSPP